jgi:hypothetical protein
VNKYLVFLLGMDQIFIPNRFSSTIYRVRWFSNKIGSLMKLIKKAPLEPPHEGETKRWQREQQDQVGR